MELDKDKEVSDDHIFLQTLLEKHGLSPKQIADWTGRGTSTIYKYLSGELTIPSVVWRAIFERTLDTAVFTLIRGDLPCIIATLANIAIPPDAASLRRLLEMRKKQINCEAYIVNILADGKIDASDMFAIANYKLAFPDMIAAQAQIYQAILHEHSKAEAVKNV